MVWDVTKPAGTEAANQGDDRIRELKTDIQTALRGDATDGDEAKFPGSDTSNPVYRYRGLKGSTGSRPAAGEYGLYCNTTLNTIQRDNGSSWDDVATLIPSGTVILFYQASAPTGWTKLTTQNDKALRIVSGTGGGAGGSISTSTTLSHYHTVDSHTHGKGSLKTVTPELGTTSGIPGGGSGTAASLTHVHDLNDGITGATAPGTDAKLGVLAYIDVIACSKD
jgi:hypothetical protein